VKRVRVVGRGGAAQEKEGGSADFVKFFTKLLHPLSEAHKLALPRLLSAAMSTADFLISSGSARALSD
jgi:hypothetical protein